MLIMKNGRITPTEVSIRPKGEREALLTKLRNLAEQDRVEEGHIEADSLLIDYIDDPEIAEAYRSIRKWYA